MSRWKISRGKATDLQDWALEESGTKEFLSELPELPKKDKMEPGLYVSYEIDLFELDGGIDWPDVGVARIFAVLENGNNEYLGEVRAYNFEAIWLSTNEYDEVDDAEEWWKCIKDDYEKLKKRDLKEEEPRGKIITSQKDIFHFTVGQLVEILKSLPQDLPVLTSGYESGFENFYQPDIIKVKHEPENMYYEGEFQVAEDEDEETFDAVVLKRVVRDE
jgi:hypothetical protein